MKFKRILKTDYFNFIKLNNLTKKLVSLVLSNTILLLGTYQCHALQNFKNFFNHPYIPIISDPESYIQHLDNIKDNDARIFIQPYNKDECLTIVMSLQYAINGIHYNIVYLANKVYQQMFIIFNQKKLNDVDLGDYIIKIENDMRALGKFVSGSDNPNSYITACESLLKALSEDPDLATMENTDKMNNLKKIIEDYNKIAYHNVPNYFLNSTKRSARKIGGPIATIIGAGLGIAAITTPVGPLGLVLYIVFGGIFGVSGLFADGYAIYENFIKTDEQIEKENKEDEINKMIIKNNMIKKGLENDKKKLEKEIEGIQKKMTKNAEELFKQSRDVFKTISFLKNKNDNNGAIIFFMDQRDCIENLGVYIHWVDTKNNGNLIKFFNMNNVPSKHLQKYPINNPDINKLNSIMDDFTKILKSIEGNKGTLCLLKHQELFESEKRIIELISNNAKQKQKALCDAVNSFNNQIKDIYSKKIPEIKRKRKLQAERDEKDRAIAEKDRAIDEKDRAIQAQLEGLVNYIMDKISHSKPVCISKLQRIFPGLNINQINDVFELIRFIRDPNHGFNIELIIQARLNGYFTTITNEMAEFIKCIVSSHKTNP